MLQDFLIGAFTVTLSLGLFALILLALEWHVRRSREQARQREAYWKQRLQWAMAPDFIEPTYCAWCGKPIASERVYCDGCAVMIEQEKMRWWNQEMSA